ncbi:ATP-binding protein [Flaviflagellibacter deserti]|uniref:histidine kinase n=1 Tax=Flaviflagellibacter deserti TaxID=2267266 RepID=A0ABV9Z1I7_9HYPH
MADRSRGDRAVTGLMLAPALLSSTAAWAGPVSASPTFGSYAVSLGLLLVTLSCGFLLARVRSRAGVAEATLRGMVAELRSKLDRAEVLVSSSNQLLVTFGGPGEEPEISGLLPTDAPVPAGRRVLGFGSWMPAGQATELEEHVARLRIRGEAFEMTVETRQGEHVAIDGRAVGGQAVLRIRCLEGHALQLAELSARHAEMQREFGRFKSLLERAPQPVWLRDTHGKISWANAAYGKAFDRPSGEEAVTAGVDLLDNPTKRDAFDALASGKLFHANVPLVSGGQKKLFDVVEVPQTAGSAGIATDMSELAGLRGDLVRRVESHRKTLDELATGVAIFQADGTLVFHNQAFGKLWRLDHAFLDAQPTDSTILDRLRAEEALPVPADFRAWKAQLQEAYRATTPREHWWHLPDGRTMRVVQTPNPEGGVTYLFDDVSERIDLESRFNALTSVQRETLDNLRDAVAVFGSDGRLTLHNPAFVQMWKLPPSELNTKPHADRVFSLCRVLHEPQEPWDLLKTAITAIPESRVPVSGRIERVDQSTIDMATVPLPDGATLVTFSDVTASVSVERALTDRNEALETASRLKSDFVKHVSYELRAPLTNIIGFSQLLADPSTGPLTDRQREYTGHVLDSSTALYAIINDILDLATIDAGNMELDLGIVNIPAAINAAVEGVRDRVTESGIALNLEVPPQIGSFVADEKRIRQVLFNLLSNAIGFSPEGSPVTLVARREADAIVFQVVDRGSGMSPEMVEKVFDRFESHTEGANHRGVGLGLSIVRSFVELHGGTVSIDSALGRGTTVTCVFPLGGGAARVAAE